MHSQSCTINGFNLILCEWLIHRVTYWSVDGFIDFDWLTGFASSRCIRKHARSSDSIWACATDRLIRRLTCWSIVSVLHWLNLVGGVSLGSDFARPGTDWLIDLAIVELLLLSNWSMYWSIKLIDWLTDLSIDWFSEWVIHWIINWFIDWPTDWSGWLAYLMLGNFCELLIGSCIDWLMCCLSIAVSLALRLALSRVFVLFPCLGQVRNLY